MAYFYAKSMNGDILSIEYNEYNEYNEYTYSQKSHILDSLYKAFETFEAFETFDVDPLLHGIIWFKDQIPYGIPKKDDVLDVFFRNHLKIKLGLFYENTFINIYDIKLKRSLLSHSEINLFIGFVNQLFKELDRSFCDVDLDFQKYKLLRLLEDIYCNNIANLYHINSSNFYDKDFKIYIKIQEEDPYILKNNFRRCFQEEELTEHQKITYSDADHKYVRDMLEKYNYLI